MRHKHRFIAYLIVLLILAALIIGSTSFPWWEQFTSPTYLRNLLLGSGAWGYALVILLLLLAIPLPIPSTPIVLASGYVYGLFTGTALSLFATILGSTVSFLLIRQFGRPLLERMVSEHHIIHFNHLFKKYGLTLALISYAIPIFPSDAVSALLGLTRTNLRTFILIVTLGHIPRFLIINSIGNDLFTGFTLKTALILGFATIFTLVALFREPIKHFLFKELKQVKKIEKTIEHWI